ncbi:Phosphate ABC transporter, permease protein [Vibrio nigripulchritudo SFn27]|nr:Phosphate ABC transporter, permease protein [Vibrio nigripulchritudo BLFn1]CCN88574.1 Phosphate ABC transporter, permease protein [Vibrio nigripulchritudo SFn27]CCN92712.1 Phosphate ABC transporter, permease protein [Vibrio nigripulchritudo ENn2]CCO40298.1 Phosphate ABC transporter, permease protein [Vibrio nigripulchritudo SFn135]CCO52718.1 Phosphate ABC transporter, permease protein [Vibrio nigripulchritudo Wn13]
MGKTAIEGQIQRTLKARLREILVSNWFKSGAPWIWLTAGAVSVSLVSVLSVLLLIGWKGLSYFWPAPLYEWSTPNGQKLIGQLYQRESMSVERLSQYSAQAELLPDEQDTVERLSIKIANRDRNTLDFISVFDFELSEPVKPAGWAVIERSQEGDFYGRPVGFESKLFTNQSVESFLEQGISAVEDVRSKVASLTHSQLRYYNLQLEKLRLEKKKFELNGTLDDEKAAELAARMQSIDSHLTHLEEKLTMLRNQFVGETLIVEDMNGTQMKLPLTDILDVWYPNDMSVIDKFVHWLGQVKKFLTEDPREGNSEGGVFPAIFGTVFLVIVMSIVVMPLGVIAAIYLNEYAKNNALTRTIRIAVINLAGVPSIVYGVFGLGFFVYSIGGSIDSLFYSEKLPSPTFGTPGLLWSALTLALLTLPVVIVATEEGLARIPGSVRQGSLALGATQFETLWRIVLPMASPAIMTGLILAVARAAGEVAPLMLVGVVKLAPSLPIDGEFPFIHLDRKFMHLGFHIYDVGFQSPNIEAARPLVYATSFLLVTVIVGLNLTAIGIRNNLREKYRTLGQD